MISKSFFKSSIIYSIVGTLPWVSGVILIPFFTAQLTSEQFGINALYYSMLAIFQIVAGFGMDAFIGVYYYEFRERKEQMKALIGTVLFSTFIIGILLILVLSAVGPSLFHLLWPKAQNLSFYPYGFYTLLTAIFSAGFKAYTSLLINQQRVTRFFWMNILNFTLTIGMSLALLYSFPSTLTGPILGRLLPMAISFTLTVILILSEFGMQVKKELFKPLIDFCTPIFIYSVMIWVVNYIDRFIIFHFIPDASFVGIFDIAVKITLFLEIFQIGLINTISPKVFAIWKEKNISHSTIEVNRYYNGLIAITMLVIPIMLITFPILIPIVIKKQIYYQALIYLPILSLGYVTRGWFYLFMAPIHYFKRTKVLPKIFLFTALFQVVISIFLIKNFGIIGAVWANFLIKPIQAFFLYLESRKFFHFSINKWKIIYLPLIFIALGIVIELLFKGYNTLMVQVVQLLATILLVFFAYKNELIPFLKGLLKR